MAEPTRQANILLDVQGLKKSFPIQAGLLWRTVGYVKAVDDISFFVRQGETLGLVGESSCGKTTAGRTILRLYEPTAGTVLFRSKLLSASGEPELVNVAVMDKAQMKNLRQEIAMIFQDPILLEPAEADNHYTEQLIRLPNLSIYYAPFEIPAAEVNRDTFGLRPKSVLFHCCQTLHKFLPQ